MMDWGGGWGGGYWVMFLFSIVFIVAVIVGIVLLVRGISGGGVGGGPAERQSLAQRETAEDVVRRRYAAGEIDREEYEQKLRDLRS